MFSWLFVAILFCAYVLAHHFFSFINWIVGLSLFVIATVFLILQIHYIYDQTTLDQRMVTGYVTSMIYQPAYSYQCGKRSCHVPENWILEQRPRPAIRNVIVNYSVRNGLSTQYCKGECYYGYPDPPTMATINPAVYSVTSFSPPLIGFNTGVDNDKALIYPIRISKYKFDRTNLNETSTILENYYNPVKASSEVIHSNPSLTIPYFSLLDENHGARVIAPNATAIDQLNLEKLNAQLNDLSIEIGIIITTDEYYFEKLKHAWHLGKPNDFVVVIYSPDGQATANIDVLTWNNYNLKEKVIEEIQAAHTTNISTIISILSNVMTQQHTFKPIDFTKYQFLNIEIAPYWYHKIIIYQLGFFVYMLLMFKHVIFSDYNMRIKLASVMFAGILMLSFFS